jgi:dienelactone hydrolase
MGEHPIAKGMSESCPHRPFQTVKVLSTLIFLGQLVAVEATFAVNHPEPAAATSSAANASPASAKAAQAVAVNQGIMARVDRDNAIYRIGETAVFTITLAKGISLPVESVPWTLTNDGATVIRSGIVSLASGPVQIEGTLERPGVLRLTVGPVGSLGESGIGVAAAAFDPFKIEATARPPADFEAFWQSQKDQLAKIPFDVKIDKVDSGKPGVEAFDVSLSVDANRRVHGYLALPSNGANLPAVVSLPGAGIRSAYLSEATEWAARGFLAIDVSVNDLPNGQAEGFYENARNSAWNNTPFVLNNYPFIGKENRENFYFRQVILGIVRAIDYLTLRPEWNGKTLILTGASQGGGLSLILAGLDPRVTAVAANVPALCEHNGAASGRPTGWPHLVRTEPGGKMEVNARAILNTAAYYDACNFARQIKVPAVVSLGLIDETVPPTTVLAAYNLLGGLKVIQMAPLSGHSGSPQFRDMLHKLVEEQLSGSKIEPTAQPPDRGKTSCGF